MKDYNGTLKSQELIEIFCQYPTEPEPEKVSFRSEPIRMRVNYFSSKMSSRKRIHTLRIRPKAGVLGRYQSEFSYTSRLSHIISNEQFASRVGAINDLMPAYNPDRFTVIYASVSLLLSILVMFAVFGGGNLANATTVFTILGSFSIVSCVALYVYIHKKFKYELHEKVGGNLRYYSEFDDDKMVWSLREWKSNVFGTSWFAFPVFEVREYSIEIEYVAVEDLSADLSAAQPKQFVLDVES